MDASVEGPNELERHLERQMRAQERQLAWARLGMAVLAAALLVALIVRGDSLEKSMSQYLIDQIRSKSNIRVALQTEVQAIHGQSNLTAVDLIDRRSNMVHREESGGLFVRVSPAAS